MKKILLLIPVILALLVSGCTAQDPKEIVKQSIEKMDALESYQASYNFSITMYGFGMAGEMEIYKKGENTRSDIRISVMGQEMIASTYYLPSGAYACTESEGNVTCIKGEAQGMISPGESLKMNTELIERGVINLMFNNIASIIGRGCYNITSNFTISKLGELEPETLAGLGISEDTLNSLEAFTQLGVTSCYDFETGMPLEMSTLIEMDMSKIPQQGVLVPGKMSMTVEMKAVSFEPNADIEDSLFELPVEPIDQSELQRMLEESETCTDSGTNETMSYREAKEIALSSECIENATLIEGTELCNEITGTWWIDLDLEQAGCAPACVINVTSKEAEINWRCTGLIPALPISNIKNTSISPGIYKTEGYVVEIYDGICSTCDTDTCGQCSPPYIVISELNKIHDTHYIGDDEVGITIDDPNIDIELGKKYSFTVNVNHQSYGIELIGYEII